jgi:hypothetical protein
VERDRIAKTVTVWRAGSHDDLVAKPSRRELTEVGYQTMLKLIVREHVDEY